jgi:UDP-4-amino-4,6-dideoxy-N-acetyl-beta-L-altrosamine N-acetyltransferase
MTGLSQGLTLRPMGPDDVPIVLPWRNHPDVRRFMLTRHAISPEEHAAYFERALRDPTKAYCLGIDGAGEPLGVVSIGAIDRANGTGTLGFYARPGTPRGTGSWLVYAGVDEAVERLRLEKLWTDAFAFNGASIRVQQKIGFRIEGVHRRQHRYDGERVDIVRLALHAEDWTRTHTARVRARLAGAPPEPPEGVEVHERLTLAAGEGPAAALERLLRARLARFGRRITALHVELAREVPAGGDLDVSLRVARRADRDATIAIAASTTGGAAVASGTAEVALAEEAP